MTQIGRGGECGYNRERGSCGGGKASRYLDGYRGETALRSRAEGSNMRALSTAGAAPLTAVEFAPLMAPFAPFESRPVLAVAVSGGRDSLALALLAHEWAAEREGRIVGLIVDHGLAPE